MAKKKEVIKETTEALLMSDHNTLPVYVPSDNEIIIGCLTELSKRVEVMEESIAKLNVALAAIARIIAVTSEAIQINAQVSSVSVEL